MTMIDEGVLSRALDDAANSFAISHEATQRILCEARTDGPGPRAVHVPAILRQQGRARTALIAAALIVAVGGVSLPLLRSEGAATKAPPRHSVAGLQAPVLSGTSFGASASSAALGAVTGTSTGLKVTATGAVAGAAKAGTSLKIESSGTINLAVGWGRVEAALTRLGDIATSDGGFVISTQASASSKGASKFSSGRVVLQVPQRFFATLVTQVQTVGHTTVVNTVSSDVTSQYVDLRARITALDASRQQYLAIMARASTISDILAVQSQLNALQSQIEQLQGQMNVLNNETTYGSLTVNVTEVGHAANSSHGASGIAKAWHDGVRGFVAGFEWLIRASGPALFALLCLGALLGVGRLAWRAMQRRRW